MSTDPNAESQALPNPEVAAEALAGAGPDPAAGTTPAAEPPASEAVAAQAAVATDAVTAEPPADAAAPASEPAVAAPALPARRTRTMALALGRRFVRLAFVVALLALGAGMGWQVYQNARPVPVVIGDPAVVGVPTPEIVAELANAIAADDSDAIRAALSPEIFSSYAADLQGFGIARVESVDTLGTYAAGPRTATELVLHGRDAQRTAFSINLVVLTENGLIVRLR